MMRMAEATGVVILLRDIASVAWLSLQVAYCKLGGSSHAFQKWLANEAINSCQLDKNADNQKNRKMHHLVHIYNQRRSPATPLFANIRCCTSMVS